MDIPLGILLIVVGAVLAFAVENEPVGLNVDALGWILIVAGVFLVVWSLSWWGWHRRTRIVERTTVTPTTERIVERDIYDDREPPL